MPTLHVPELLVILAIVLIVFGAGRLPEIGSSLGKGIREFRRGVSGEDAASAKTKGEGDGPAPTKSSHS
jgi:sec-independent protein translocase protein TatA